MAKFVHRPALRPRLLETEWEQTMANGNAPSEPRDRDDLQGRINVREAHEVTYWTNRFDVTPEQLTHAIANVGPLVRDVARYLHKSL